MKKVTTKYGYDVYELTKDECKRNGRIYPLLCAFPNDWDEKEDGKRHVNYSNSEFETLQEFEDWAKEYRRD